MPLAKNRVFTEDDYYNLPENVRAELIEGNLIYNQAAPSRIHQTILSELHTVINNYIKSNQGACRVYPAPFAVKLREDSKTIVEPDLSIICDKNKLDGKRCNGAPDFICILVYMYSKYYNNLQLLHNLFIFIKLSVIIKAI